MPTYDYKCTDCNYTFEAFQPMTAQHLKECPKCNGIIKRMIGTGAGPIFRGSGFYQTDYKNTKSSNAKESKPVKDSKKSKSEKMVD
jgi:putative FmdB family regulatory protein